MKTENVKQNIQDLFKANLNHYPENYPIVSGMATEEASMHVADVAIGYFENRNEDEVERDEGLAITEMDYVEWCMDAFADALLQRV